LGVGGGNGGGGGTQNEVKAHPENKRIVGPGGQEARRQSTTNKTLMQISDHTSKGRHSGRLKTGSKNGLQGFFWGKGRQGSGRTMGGKGGKDIVSGRSAFPRSLFKTGRQNP